MYSEELLLSAKKLRFPPSVEAAFLMVYNTTTLQTIRRFGWAFVGITLFSALLDTIFFVHYRWEFFVIRCAMAVVVSVSMLRYRTSVPRDDKRIHILWYFVVAAFLFNLFQMFITPKDGAYSNYGITNVVFMVLCFLLSRASYYQACIGAALMIVAYNVFAIPYQLIPNFEDYRTIYGGTNVRLLFMYIVLGVFGYLQESGKRQDFIKTELLKQERHRVQQQNNEILRQQEILESSARDVELANTSLQNLNDELYRVNQELREANAFKTRILSMASHDLKNPLTGILGITEVLLDGEDMTEMKSRMVQQVQTSADQMLRMIQGLLDSSAIELGAIQLQISCINAQDVWENVLVNLNETARKKQQTIVQRIEADCMVFADAIRLYQIFENLCSNAIKYSPIGAQILVVLETRGSNLRFLVEDEGPGIAESDKAKLFGLFQKLSATPTAGESSHGVGLAIVKQIVDAHGGTIRVEVASKGKGTVFIVELPLQSERAISQNHLSEVQL